MLDLIYHGLSLREKFKNSDEVHPQVIRVDSASLIPCLSKDSTISAESAVQYNDRFDNVKMLHGAGIADHAEDLRGQDKLIAGQLRESCGLISISQTMLGNYQKMEIIEPIKTICDCGYRPPICSCGHYKFIGKK